MHKFKEAQIIGFYILFFVLIIGSITFFTSPNLLSKSNFLNWDAAHYHWITLKGYNWYRVAFFPLFPLIWKMLGFGVYGITLLNSLLFLTSFYFLVKSMNLIRFELLLYLSIPSFIFFFLPYSESIFFCCTVVIILGVRKKLFWLVLFGIFLCTLSRPAFTVLIPALILMELISELRDKAMLKRILGYVFVSFLGVLLVGIIQYNDTKEWFTFFKIQSLWGNKLQIPHLPFTSWGGNMITRLDGVALLFGASSGIVLFLFIFKSIKFKSVSIPKEVLLSLGYLGGITMTVLIFRGGCLFSLNRFVFATPFIIVVINYFLSQKFTFSNKKLGLFLFLLIIYWLSFASYVHIQAFLKYFLVSIYVLLFLGVKSNSPKISKVSMIGFILLNLIFQVLFFKQFLLSHDGIGFVG